MDGDYSPLSAGETARRRRLLRTAELNMVGRLALLGSCAAGGVSFAIGRVLGLPAAVAASAGGLIPVAVVAALDRRRWRAMLAGYGWGGTAAEVSEVAADLARRGVAAHVELDGDGENASLRYRNADGAVVSTVLAERRASHASRSTFGMVGRHAPTAA